LSEFFEKKIEGFGELFRKLSYEEVGEAAMISRAVAGTVSGKLVFCLPGSKNAVKLALSKLILPGLGHILKEANR
jgi:molybdenum cofactor biosynthesis protein B